ncbi:hypothetical protein ACIRNI_04355 [Streptomyces sp. NPDC093546]|uniref:hypothetical protein n=1 Tax=Streptomyces sp. NPDC093546 TaxID=3366040 RepID=UPI003812FFCA
MTGSQQPSAGPRWLTGFGPADAVTLGYLDTSGAAVDADRLRVSLARATGSRPAPAVTVHDTPGLGWEAVDTALKAAESAAPRPFDLASGAAPVRAELRRWSGGCLLVVQVHRSASTPKPGPGPDPQPGLERELELLEAEIERCYADATAAPQSHLTAAAPQSHLTAAAPEPHPTATPAPVGPDGAAPPPPYHQITLDGPVVDRLLALADDPAATPACVLFAVYALALGSVTGQRDFRTGLAVPGRAAPAPVRVRIPEGGLDDPGDAFRSVLAAVSAVRGRPLGPEEPGATEPNGHDQDPWPRAVFTDRPLCATRTLRLGEARLVPTRLRPHTVACDVLAEAIDPARPDGRRYLRLTSDPTALGARALRDLAAAVEATARRLTAAAHTQEVR